MGPDKREVGALSLPGPIFQSNCPARSYVIERECFFSDVPSWAFVIAEIPLFCGFPAPPSVDPGPDAGSKSGWSGDSSSQPFRASVRGYSPGNGVSVCSKGRALFRSDLRRFRHALRRTARPPPLGGDSVMFRVERRKENPPGFAMGE
jgi:hypothetical protein